MAERKMQATLTYDHDDDVEIIQPEQAYYNMVDGEVVYIIDVDATEATVLDMTGAVEIWARKDTVFEDSAVWVDMIPLKFASVRFDQP